MRDERAAPGISQAQAGNGLRGYKRDLYEGALRQAALARWPGVVPAGRVTDGPWALYRMFDRVSVQPGAAPEKFRATFDIDGRKATFDVTSSSVKNALRLPELRSFQCPNGL
mgnify:CR=1 FL=1